jgi:hypothetical protein
MSTPDGISIGLFPIRDIVASSASPAGAALTRLAAAGPR